MRKKINEKTPQYIVGIGASAGGLEAIHEMFDNVPENTGFSFVIVQHLSSDHKSLMGELLSKHTSMQIFEAKDGMRLEKNCVYLIPNKFMITLEKRKLLLHEKLADHGPNNAVDIFLESLAADAGPEAIGVILSGTGTDGTKGIEAIKNKGGIVVVQDPISAKFDGMPNSAVASGYADLILAPEMIAEELIDFIEQAPLIRSFNDQKQKDDYVIVGILELVHTITGYNFLEYKKPTIYRRLAKRMGELAIRTPSDYLNYLRNNAGEPKILCKEFLIGVTKFFRDTEAFAELRTTTIPALFKEKATEPLIKVWVVACSTGEEAYSIAILLLEYMEAMQLQGRNVKIFATDIDSEALDKASKGVYPESAMEDVPAEFISKYFVQEGSGYRVTSALRKMVVFAHHNIISDPPFSRIDMISCRNMLIYMGLPPQKIILKAFHFALNLEGFLFLGPSENIGILKDSFLEISRKWKIYKCILKSTQASYSPLLSAVDSPVYGKYSPTVKAKNALNALPEIFNQSLFEVQNYAGILIDKDFEVKQATGNFKNFLNFPDSSFNFGLLKLVHPDLSTPISIAVRKASKENQRAVINNIKIDDGQGGVRIIDIIVKPYLIQREYLQPFLFVILHEQRVSSKERQDVSNSFEATGSQDVSELERELNETKESLHALVEEVESANEELQTSNEEIISANEELQSTNEELQSLNEELHTVNAEHQLKIRELIELNDDLNNYFRNADIGQVIIDKKLVIRKFSPAATKQVNLIESDIGRSIIDISNNFKDLDFINSIKAVLSSGMPTEKEVIMGNDSLFLMKVNPYLRADKSIDGVVISFVDVTEVKRLDSILSAVFNISPSAIVAQMAIRNDDNEIIDFEYVMMNKAAMEMMPTRKGSLVGRKMSELYPKIDSTLFERFVNVVETGKPVHYEIRTGDKWYEVACVKMMDGLVTTSTDITAGKHSAEMLSRGYDELQSTLSQLKVANEQLQISNMDLYQFASIASHDLKEPLRKIIAFGNILDDKISGKINDQERNYLDKIIKASGRMQNLIEDVLTFSRLSNTELPLEPTALNEVVAAVMEDLEIAITNKNAVINIGPLPEVHAVPAQMRQLFHNLISNGLKFNSHDEPVISIREIHPAPELLKTLQVPKGKFSAIEVRDNGIGFEEKYRDKIFKMFQRLDSTATGTGIGLAICKKIVENHGGQIIAESELNVGSAFTILLPVLAKPHSTERKKKVGSV